MPAPGQCHQRNGLRLYHLPLQPVIDRPHPLALGSDADRRAEHLVERDQILAGRCEIRLEALGPVGQKLDPMLQDTA